MLDYRFLTSPTYDFPVISDESILPHGYVPSYNTLFKMKREAEGLKFRAFLVAFYDKNGSRQKFASALWDLALCFENAIYEAERAESDREFQNSLHKFPSAPF